MGAPMSPAYVRGSLASTVASSTTTAIGALASASAGKLTVTGVAGTILQESSIATPAPTARGRSGRPSTKEPLAMRVS